MACTLQSALLIIAKIAVRIPMNHGRGKCRVSVQLPVVKFED